MRRLLLVATVLGVALAVAGGAQARVVPGQYIVVLDDESGVPLARRWPM